MSLSRLVARLFHGLHHEVESCLGGRKVRREAAFVADVGVVSCLLERRLQGVEDLGTHAQRLRGRLAPRPA